MNFSIVIVNWNSKELLRACLKSLPAVTGESVREIVIVDNASFDGVDLMLAAEFPEARFIQAGKNLGFSAANNLGVRSTSTDTLLFLNPDTEIIGDALTQLYATLWSSSEIGAVGARLLNSDQTVQTSCIQVYPTVLNQLLDSDYLRRKFPHASLWGMSALFNQSDKPSEVNVISGACIMIKRKVFDQVGGFSTAYFMYSEDVELGYRVRESGHKVMYVPGATVIHHGGSSADKAPSHFSVVMIRESIFRFLSRTRGDFYADMYRMSMMIASLGRLFLISCRRLIRGADLKTIAATAKWKAVMRWSLGLEQERLRAYGLETPKP